MRKHLLAAGIAAAALIPSMALAQTTCEQQRSQRVAGTVAGAGIGALAGSAVAGRDDRTKGAVIGGLAGALLGNQLTKGNGDCAHAYGYYDNNGMWHATGVAQNDAQGYYDRSGNWVSGAPNGHYDSQGRWVTASTSASAAGYWDAQGRWVPASASGYYDQNGNWIAGSASGYYDTRGRWVAGPATGRYDANGRWIPGQPAGHRDANGVWVADAQPGYYDSNGRWRAGPAMGYYDTRGQWIATAPAAGAYGANVTYQTNGMWSDAPNDIRSRISWLDTRIERALRDGSLRPDQANRARSQLAMIRQDERRLPHPRGQLRQRDQMALQDRLDRVADMLNRRDRDRDYDRDRRGQY